MQHKQWTCTFAPSWISLLRIASSFDSLLSPLMPSCRTSCRALSRLNEVSIVLINCLYCLCVLSRDLDSDGDDDACKRNKLTTILQLWFLWRILQYNDSYWLCVLCLVLTAVCQSFNYRFDDYELTQQHYLSHKDMQLQCTQCIQKWT